MAAKDANGNCAECGKPVIFIEDENGTRQILDANKIAVWRVIKKETNTEDGLKIELLAVKVDEAHQSHFTTCTNPGKFSKKKK